MAASLAWQLGSAVRRKRSNTSVNSASKPSSACCFTNRAARAATSERFEARPARSRTRASSERGRSTISDSARSSSSYVGRLAIGRPRIALRVGGEVFELEDVHLGELLLQEGREQAQPLDVRHDAHEQELA